MANYVDVIGPAKGNKQSITIIKKYEGSGNTIITTPEKVDEYVANHSKACSKDTKKALLSGGLGGLLGAAAGLVYNSLRNQKSAGILGAIGVCFGSAAGFLTALFFKSSEGKVVQDFINNNK